MPSYTVFKVLVPVCFYLKRNVHSFISFPFAVTVGKCTIVYCVYMYFLLCVCTLSVVRVVYMITACSNTKHYPE